MDATSADLSRLQNTIHSFCEKSQRHNFQVSEVSELLCMSERNLRRKFQKLFGKGPAEVIAVFRIKKAKELLVSGCAVSDVTHHLKYSSNSHFPKAFKALVGVSPSGCKDI